MDRNLSIRSGSSSSICNIIYALQEDAIQRCPGLIVLKEDKNKNNNKLYRLTHRFEPHRPHAMPRCSPLI